MIRGWDQTKTYSLTCPICETTLQGVGCSIGVCPACVRNRWDESRRALESFQAGSREVFQLPHVPPATPGGLLCNLCLHRCRMGENEKGYCGIRKGSEISLRRDGRYRAPLSYYYDPLPTNCVADWVCAGGTGAGFPSFAHDSGPEVGFYNLAVFFESCNFNCLYCQNWQFKKGMNNGLPWGDIEMLSSQVNSRTSCICYFGGDPTPQVPYALRVSDRARREHPDQILRICWETNGSVHPAWLRQMFRQSCESGGCLKVDLKAWDPNIHKALCGCDNRLVLKNFSRLAEWAGRRLEPPVLVASTLLVPGYVEEEEIGALASFIASLNPDIPYTLLAFAPQFCLEDFPTLTRDQAEACLKAARRAGLRRIHLGNRHLIH